MAHLIKMIQLVIYNVIIFVFPFINRYYNGKPRIINTMIPIAFIDDHATLRKLMIRALESLPYGYKVLEYENGNDFLTRFPKEKYKPSVVLMDISMPVMNGYDTTLWLKDHYPDIPVLLLSDLDLPNAIVNIVKCKADGYTSKVLASDPNHLHSIIELLMSGQEYYDNPLLYQNTKNRIAKGKHKTGVESLTKLQMKIIKTTADDTSVDQKAKENYMSPHTYNNHLSKIYKKLGINSVNALRKYAASIGLIKI